METLDARGKSCPLPIVLMAKHVKTMAAGAQVAVRADDRAFPEDVRAWCKKTQNELVSLEDKVEDKKGFYEAVVKKSAL